MKKYLVLGAIFVPMLVLQNPVMAEPAENFRITGELVFNGDMEECLSLNVSFDSLNISGIQIDAPHIRDSYRTGGETWDSMKNNISAEAERIFNRTLWAMHSHSVSSISTSIDGLGQEGPLYLNISGKGRLNMSEDYDSEFLALIINSGGIFNIPVEAANGMNISISVLEGYLINDAKTYQWNGDDTVFEIKKAGELRKNTAEMVIDIYRIDTSGMEQNLYANLSIESNIYNIPIPDDMRNGLPDGVHISQASIELLNYSMEHALISSSDFNNYSEQMVSEIEDRMIREFPGVMNVSHSMEQKNSSILVSLNAQIKAPVEDFSSASFLRWYSSQKILIKLSGMEGFICNYTVIVPEGMKILGTSSSPHIPVFHTAVDGRSAFRAMITEDGEYSISVTLGVLIELDPLIPLISIAIITFILWFFVRKYLPERKGKHE